MTNKSQRALDRLDPVEFEVLRHRLWVIQGELGTTIKSMSGSPIASEAGDFNTCLMDAQGNGVLTGLFITAQGAVTSWVVRFLIEDYGLEMIKEGDMYLCNDPWKGALHQNDVACVAPMFVDGELVAWVGSVIHQLDVGGAVPGSFAVGASSVFEEAGVFPAIRIVRDGEVQRDVEAGYLRRSRMPHLMSLDLRAQIAANNIAMDRLNEVVEQYNVQTLKDVFTGMIELVEHKIRQRLKTLPFTSFTETVLLDDDGLDHKSVYTIVLEITNDENGLTLDFSKSSPQAPALINCARPALDAGAVSALLSLLCYDMPWTPAGIERCITVKSQPGTVCDASWPAGVSGGSLLGGRTASYAVMSAIGRLYALGGKELDRATAGWLVSGSLVQVFGADKNHIPFGTMLMESGVGYAASGVKDGLNSAGLPDSPAASIGDIEDAEMASPLLYLFRKENQDTGGAGRYRGGVSVSSAFQLVDGAGAGAYAVGQGYNCELTYGLMGGSPAPVLNNFKIMGVGEADMGVLYAVGDQLQSMFGDQDSWPEQDQQIPMKLEGEVGIHRLFGKHKTQLMSGDVYALGCGGGAGYGDPWSRPVDEVVQDVEQGYVSQRGALDDYGVKITESPTGAVSGSRPKDRDRVEGESVIQSITTKEGRQVVRVQKVENGLIVDDVIRVEDLK